MVKIQTILFGLVSKKTAQMTASKPINISVSITNFLLSGPFSQSITHSVHTSRNAITAHAKWRIFSWHVNYIVYNYTFHYKELFILLVKFFFIILYDIWNL